jgi:hypothetical protein
MGSPWSAHKKLQGYIKEEHHFYLIPVRLADKFLPLFQLISGLIKAGESKKFLDTIVGYFCQINQQSFSFIKQFFSP